MNWLRKLKLIPAVLALWYVATTCPAPVLMAAEPPAAEPDSVSNTGASLDRARALIGAQDSLVNIDETLDRARALIDNRHFDRAIELLKTVIDHAPEHFDHLRKAYLLLIMSHVYLSNASPDSSETAAQLFLDKANVLIENCLRIKELRHTQPVPESEYPKEMVSAFSDVRARIFGSFRVRKLEPRDAVVMLDGDTLRSMPGDSLPGDVDLAVGQPHTVSVLAMGYKGLSEGVSISPSTTAEPSFQLRRRRSRIWYTTVATGTVGVVGGVIALLTRGGGGPEVVQPLPGPPPPPTQ